MQIICLYEKKNARDHYFKKLSQCIDKEILKRKKRYENTLKMKAFTALRDRVRYYSADQGRGDFFTLGKNIYIS